MVIPDNHHFALKPLLKLLKHSMSIKIIFRFTRNYVRFLVTVRIFCFTRKLSIFYCLCCLCVVICWCSNNWKIESHYYLFFVTNLMIWIKQTIINITRAIYQRNSIQWTLYNSNIHGESETVRVIESFE